MARNPLLPTALPSYAQVRDAARKVMAGTTPVDPVPTAEYDVDGRPVPKDLDPVPEGRQPFIPYRGTEFHGLDPMRITSDPQGYGDGTTDVVWDAEPAPDHIINVRVVKDDAEQIAAFRTSQTSVGPNATPVVSRQRNRTKLKIKHIGTSTDGTNVRVWIGHNESVSAYTAYPLEAGESLDITSTEAIWMMSSTAAVVPLAMWFDFTQDV